MINRLQVLLLLGTASLAGIVMFTINDVGSGFPVSDGGSHYVTGLLAFDWLHAPELSNPLHFGTEYFKHFPYIGLLLWPPLFYGLEALVFSAFGPTIQVALMFNSAIFAAGAAVLGYAALRGGKNIWVALCITATVLTSTLIQEVQRNLLIDGLVSVLSLVAIFQFAYFLVKPSWRGALTSGLLTVLAFYAKGNAMQLGLAFPLLALMLRRPGMLIDRRTLAMAAGCIVITAPWLYLTAGLSAQGFLYSFALKDLLELAGTHLYNVITAMPILAPFAGIGAISTIRNFTKAKYLLEPATVFNTACLSAVVACIVFHTMIPAGADGRYMLTAVFGCFGLAASGLESLLAWMIARLRHTSVEARNASLVVAGVFALQAVIGITSPQETTTSGAGIAASEVMRLLPESNRSVLISGDHNLETSVGPALAALDGTRRASKNGAIVVRGSRAFGSGAYRNRDYVEKFKDDAAYGEELRRLGVPIVVTTSAKVGEHWGHIAAIERVLMAKESDYVRTAVIPFLPPHRISVWRRKDALIKPVDFELVSESNTMRERVSKVIR